MVWSVADQAAVYTVAPCTSARASNVSEQCSRENEGRARGLQLAKSPAHHKKQSKRAYSVIVGMQDPHQQK